MEDLPDRKQQEHDSFSRRLHPAGLYVRDIRSDGHCLYNAIADQLDMRGGTKLPKSSLPTHLHLRAMAADYISQNKDLFMPFLESEAEHQVLSDKDFQQYCRKITQPHPVVWGGYAEIVALSHVLRRQVAMLELSSLHLHPRL